MISCAYKFSHCCKEGHKYQLKKYVCVEDYCFRDSIICQTCFDSFTSKHWNHTVLKAEFLLNKIIRQTAAGQSTLTSLTRRIQREQQIIQRSQILNAEVCFSLERLRQIVVYLTNIKKQPSLSSYQTRRFLKISCQLLGKSGSFLKNKVPLSLNIPSSDMPILTPSQLFQCLIKQIKDDGLNKQASKENNTSGRINSILLRKQINSQLLKLEFSQSHLQDVNIFSSSSYCLDQKRKVISQRTLCGEIYNLVEIGESTDERSPFSLATLDQEGYLRFWDTSTLHCERLMRVRKSNNNCPGDIYLIKRLNCLAVTFDDFVGLVDVKSFQTIKRFPIKADNIDSIDDVSILLLVEQESNKIVLYNYITGTSEGCFFGDLDSQITAITSIKTNTNEILILTGSSDGIIKQFNFSKQILKSDQYEQSQSLKISKSVVYYIDRCQKYHGGEALVAFSINQNRSRKPIATDITLICFEPSLQIISILRVEDVLGAVCYSDTIYLVQNRRKRLLKQLKVSENNKLVVSSEIALSSAFDEEKNVVNTAVRMLSSSKCLILADYSQKLDLSRIQKFPLLQKIYNGEEEVEQTVNLADYNCFV